MSSLLIILSDSLGQIIFYEDHVNEGNNLNNTLQIKKIPSALLQCVV